jgi:hypothetical protein
MRGDKGAYKTGKETENERRRPEEYGPNVLATRSGQPPARASHSVGPQHFPNLAIAHSALFHTLGAGFSTKEKISHSNTSFPIRNSFQTILLKPTRPRRAALLSFSSISCCSFAFLSSFFRIASSTVRMRAAPKAFFVLFCLPSLVFLTRPSFIN